ncbi:hypothetical protein EYF80_035385 [Liparis tanakae]|uniref:Uncharacterized protein n=1 Tax=Liparis tanakae TaxID=230148 RepID=A0A4Z2GLP3_9TELE|nr:hypothetical protein EYF80_035385 [Liparis tanakae]
MLLRSLMGADIDSMLLEAQVVFLSPVEGRRAVDEEEVDATMSAILNQGCPLKLFANIQRAALTPSCWARRGGTLGGDLEDRRQTASYESVLIAPFIHTATELSFLKEHEPGRLEYGSGEEGVTQSTLAGSGNGEHTIHITSLLFERGSVFISTAEQSGGQRPFLRTPRKSSNTTHTDCTPRWFMGYLADVRRLFNLCFTELPSRMNFRTAGSVRSPGIKAPTACSQRESQKASQGSSTKTERREERGERREERGGRDRNKMGQIWLSANIYSLITHALCVITVSHKPHLFGLAAGRSQQERVENVFSSQEEAVAVLVQEDGGKRELTMVAAEDRRPVGGQQNPSQPPYGGASTSVSNGPEGRSPTASSSQAAATCGGASGFTGSVKPIVACRPRHFKDADAVAFFWDVFTSPMFHFVKSERCRAEFLIPDLPEPIKTRRMA